MPRGRPRAPAPDRPTSVDQVAHDRLRSIVLRHERLEEEREALVEDQKEVLKEAKATGFDVKAIRKVLKRRKRERHQIEEEDDMIDLYERVLRDGGNGPPEEEEADNSEEGL